MKKEKPHPCTACRNFLKGQCDILGEITEDKLKLCKIAGYRETKQTYSSVRHYCNKIGARFEY
jgi:hypothetical protein